MMAVRPPISANLKCIGALMRFTLLLFTVVVVCTALTDAGGQRSMMMVSFRFRPTSRQPKFSYFTAYVSKNSDKYTAYALTEPSNFLD